MRRSHPCARDGLPEAHTLPHRNISSFPPDPILAAAAMQLKADASRPGTLTLEPTAVVEMQGSREEQHEKLPAATHSEAAKPYDLLRSQTPGRLAVGPRVLRQPPPAAPSSQTRAPLR